MPADRIDRSDSADRVARVDRVVRVLPDVSALRKTFDYTVPGALAGQVRVGTQVRIALGPRRVGGWVVEDDVEPAPGVALRPIAAVRGWGPPPAVLDIATWAAWRWAGPVPALLGTASPPRAVRALPVVAPSSGERSRLDTAPADTAPADTAPADTAPADTANLGEGISVVRLGPGTDPWPWLAAAAVRLEHAEADAGVLVLAPGLRAARNMARRLRASGTAVALLPDDWATARAGGCVVVGARAAAFAPLPRLAAAVVLDAHDEAYHEERAPTWAAWAVVAERARRDGAPCALVSPCPTLEIMALGPLVVPARSAERRGWPIVEVIDRRGDDPRTGLFSERLVRLVRDVTGEAGGRVVCVVNRTGRVRLLSCAECGELARCETCGAELELVGEARRPKRGADRARAAAPDASSDAAPDAPAAAPRLRCRRCGEERPVVCARCGATRMKALRLGVTRVGEELEALTGVAVAEVWGPGTADEEHDEQVARARVVVGTEAALHRVRGVDAVAFLEFDSELLAPRFRAAEQALGLLARAARLVSRRPGAGAADRAPGRVVVQTRQPRHPALVAAVSADPGVLAAAESEVRMALDLPPFSALAVVSGPAADAYGAALRQGAGAEVEVRGPVDGTWSVRARDHAALADLLAAVPRPPGRLRVEVDPVRS
jgi:primosomal protein N' (replication factor Y) (superfamily II helicase)